ncbi:hypothetical protein F5880DRAFT_1613564 [Lentinula raphanica]|nr:hypothetical protein F5880DRAFT_1613564 [Lentinula raphanica]
MNLKTALSKVQLSAETHKIFIDTTPGGYSDMKMSGKKLADALAVDYPEGSANLKKAPDLKPTVSTFLRRFTNVIHEDERLEIERLWLLMQEQGLKFRQGGDSNHSATPAIHVGIWEKFANQPRLTTETWKIQNGTVQACMDRLIGLLSEKVAPRMVSILRTYYPEQNLSRCPGSISEVLAVAIKTGSSERDHLDWSDGKFGLTWVSGVGDWQGADLKALETGWQYPLQPGDAILANMRQMVHSASPISSGQRITLTFLYL